MSKFEIIEGRASVTLYRRLFACAAGLCALTAALPAGAEPGASDWVNGQLSQVRLIVGSFDGSAYQAGIEIRLKGVAHTYWRNPGDGGVPPIFNFANSRNVASAKVSFPAPKRSGRPGEEIIGYFSTITFPLRIKPIKASQPARISLKLNYAACEKICVPELANLTLDLKPKSTFPAHASVIARYEAALPKSFAAANAPKLMIKNIAPRKRWSIHLKSKDTKANDLFIEAPDMWYFDTKRTPDGGFAVKLLQGPEKKGAIPPVRLTLTSSAGAFEGAHTLP